MWPRRTDRLARLAPWGLIAAQSWLLDQLLKQRSGRDAPTYAALERRLDRLARSLKRLAVASAVARPAGPSIDRGPATDLAPQPQSPAGPGDYRTVTLRNGVRFEVALDGRWRDPIATAVATGQSWFLDDFEVLLDLVKPGCRVLDLGGHLGTFGLAAAALGGRVLCVEAAPENVRLLRASVARNGFERMLVVHGAATDRDGALEFLPNGPWGTIANPSVRRSPAMMYAGRLAPVDVPALRVDKLLARLGWDGVDLAKIDIEGAEVGAIRGMSGLLSRPDGPVLLYESNAHALPFFGETAASLASALEGFGYSSYTVEPGRLIPTRPGDFRAKCVVNCLAVKGQPPLPPGWRVAEPRSPDETIRTIIAESRTSSPHDRAYLARALAEADPSIVAEPRVGFVLRRLADDADESVRAAAAWFATAESGRRP